MKLNKSQRSNLIFFIVLLLIIFTPIRSYVHFFKSKVRAVITSVELIDNPMVIDNNNWILNGVNTENINFSELKGEVIFINFWATWCPPCRAEMPSIQELYDEYSDTVSFVMISDETPDAIQQFLDKKNYTFPVYNSTSNFPKEFKVSSIPATYIINQEGEVIVHEVGAVDWFGKDVKVILNNLLVK